MRQKSLILLFLANFLFSCSDFEDDPIPENSSSTTFGIRHDRILSDYELVATNSGVYGSNDYPSFLPVVKFCYSLNGSQDIEYVASGTLISSKWILTAGHNFYVADEQSSPAEVSGIKVFFGTDPNGIPEVYEVEKLVFHPTWVQDNDGFFYANDLCLVKLKKTAPSSITPAIVNYTLDKEVIGSKVWFAGFGDYSQQVGRNPDLLSPKHAFENVLDRRVTGIKTSINGKEYVGGLLAIDFDSPDGLVNSLGDDYDGVDEMELGSGSSSPEALELEGTTIEGDSGGPLFLKTSEGWVVIGVLSGGADKPIKNHKDSSYGDISIFIRTASSASWILETIK